jgi:hypothetical protein
MESFSSGMLELLVMEQEWAWAKTTHNFTESLIKEMGTHDTLMLKAVRFLRAE